MAGVSEVVRIGSAGASWGRELVALGPFGASWSHSGAANWSRSSGSGANCLPVRELVGSSHFFLRVPGLRGAGRALVLGEGPLLWPEGAWVAEREPGLARGAAHCCDSWRAPPGHGPECARSARLGLAWHDAWRDPGMQHEIYATNRMVL